ncbi:mitochondrial glycerol-3-phosphate dehydrogenase subunit C [Andalucia godoyi]|uniref:Mitochondrial glycerol-3-phosphate dehydrogenase subunit C n=1 Tax=Andalucia godoyi TaxID=505711 RepID=A0A8K0F474_ANDGO|nr:mitochondrial glycerol-3-phosphate dehydrogenase subunit C [Andalucia godoyi]|eukprot:ANDGO_03947.mRNA.1 mitochondrial glycerol-3-phosphate dehydrogenase subunit C
MNAIYRSLRTFSDKAVKKGAPFRRPIPWKSSEFYDESKLDTELRRVFDVCHGCRRCFNLCNSFPRLFDLVDNSKTAELNSVPSSEFKSVVDDCTLCDMCATTKCPYVPPHEFNIDFPHLMLRYRAVENKTRNVGVEDDLENVPLSDSAYGVKASNIASHVEVQAGVPRELKLEPTSFADRLVTSTDTNGNIGSKLSCVANAALHNDTVRRLMSTVVDVHHKAAIPPYSPVSFVSTTVPSSVINENAPAFAVGRKAVLYATCLVNFNYPAIGHSAVSVLQHNGVSVETSYPGCCGMPQLEQGDLSSVAEKARAVCNALVDFVDRGYQVITLTPSCGLMFRQEWPLLLPNDPLVLKVSSSTKDICEYVMDIAKSEGIVRQNMRPLTSGVSLHFACHSRAQNFGNKALEMLKLIPEAKVNVIEKCSGHGGSWGCKTKKWETALKVGAPVAKRVSAALAAGESLVASECALAGLHISQSVSLQHDQKTASVHPIQLLAESYGFQHKM